MDEFTTVLLGCSTILAFAGAMAVSKIAKQKEVIDMLRGQIKALEMMCEKCTKAAVILEKQSHRLRSRQR